MLWLPGRFAGVFIGRAQTTPCVHVGPTQLLADRGIAYKATLVMEASKLSGQFDECERMLWIESVLAAHLQGTFAVRSRPRLKLGVTSRCCVAIS